jgi:hypothetical protein
MVTVRLLSSDLPNHYRAILFASPAAIELEALGALSDALVYCRRHERYAVVEEKRLLTGAEAEIGVHLERCCRTAANRVYEAFEPVEKTDNQAFYPSPFPQGPSPFLVGVVHGPAPSQYVAKYNS